MHYIPCPYEWREAMGARTNALGRKLCGCGDRVGELVQPSLLERSLFFGHSAPSGAPGYKQVCLGPHATRKWSKKLPSHHRLATPDGPTFLQSPMGAERSNKCSGRVHREEWRVPLLEQRPVSLGIDDPGGHFLSGSEPLIEGSICLRTSRPWMTPRAFFGQCLGHEDP